MSKAELLPLKAQFTPDEAVEIEVRGVAPDAPLTVFHLGDKIAEASPDADGIFRLPPLPEGGYSVELGDLRTAFDVNASPRSRLRYGFVASYEPGKNVAAVADTVRRLHLNGMQFYDWAYRHADLLGGGNAYADPLGQTISRDTIAALIRAVQEAGSRALGYAAVYGVGNEEWPSWRHDALLNGEGKPWGLGDFLSLVDPAAPDWRDHFRAELGTATKALGFDGFHLDQYGYPKRAIRADGAEIDLARSFADLIAALRETLPEAHLVFNNVNDFPTRTTAGCAQDAVYIEPWAPQDTLQSLADTITRARAFGAGKPVVLAAYQSVYKDHDGPAADRATQLTMATIFSHGGTQLLAGEADRLLFDPYYVRNHAAAPATLATLARWYDFLVAHDELLMPDGLTEVTHSHFGAYNGDVEITYPRAGVSVTAEAGKVWCRIVEAGTRLVIHLVNLAGQTDTLWDAPRKAFGDPGPGTLEFRRLFGRTPRVRIADPDGIGRLTDLPVTEDGAKARVTLPPLYAWQMLVIDPAFADREATTGSLIR